MDNIFGTTADVYQSGLNSPINPAFMTPGWGINPSLMTPSYDAPYRPQYMGPSGYSPYGRPGFIHAGANMLGLRNDPYWGNPVDNMQPSIQSFTSKPFDAMAWGAQNVVAPYIGYSGAAKILGPASSNMWGAGAAGANSWRNGWGIRGVQGMAGGVNSIGGYAKSLWQGQGIAAGLGRGLGEGVAGAFTTNAAIRGAIGGMGGLVGGLAIPLAVGQAVTSGINAAFVDPYVNSRQNSDILQNNFRNVYFGENNGNAVSGKGLSYSASARMGVNMMHAGLHDNMFSREEFSNIADMGMRAGLFDNVKSSQITQRLKDVSEQIKLIVSISNDPDIRNAIEELSKLNLAGASVTGGTSSVASQTYRHLGGFAAIAGTSVQKMMNTVGAQGQYLFQSNGMTPYLGQLAAANSLAGFSSAQRVGLLSPAVLARMGGLEGATQSSVSAQVVGAQTPFAMMMAYNRYIGGSNHRGVTGTVATFGGLAAHNPLEAIGNMDLYGPAAAGADMASQGSMGLENQAVQILKHTAQLPLGPGGTYTASQLMAVYTRYMGLSPDQARGEILRRAAEQDDKSYNQRVSALQGNMAEQTRQFINQEGLGGGPIDTALRGTKRFIRGTGSAIASAVVDPVAEAVGGFGDFGARTSDWWNYGRSVESGSRVSSIDDLFSSSSNSAKSTKTLNTALYNEVGGNTTASDLALFWDKTHLSNRQSKKLINQIRDLHLQGDKDATALVNAKTKEEQEAALEKLLKSKGGSLDSSAATLYTQSGLEGLTSKDVNSNRNQFLSSLNDIKNLGLVSESMKVGDTLDKLQTGVGVSVGRSKHKGGLAQDLQTIGAAAKLMLMNRPDANGNYMTDSEIADMVMNDTEGKYKGILEEAGNDRSKIKSTIEKINKRAATQRLVGYGLTMFGMGLGDISGKSAEEQLEIAKKALGQRGGVIYDEGISAVSANAAGDEQLAKYLSLVQSHNDMFKQQSDAHRKDVATYDGVVDKFNKIDGASTFKSSIDKFDHAVDRLIAGTMPSASASIPSNMQNGSANTQTNNDAKPGSGAWMSRNLFTW